MASWDAAPTNISEYPPPIRTVKKANNRLNDRQKHLLLESLYRQAINHQQQQQQQLLSLGGISRLYEKMKLSQVFAASALTYMRKRIFCYHVSVVVAAVAVVVVVVVVAVVVVVVVVVVAAVVAVVVVVVVVAVLVFHLFQQQQSSIHQLGGHSHFSW